ncbi:MAG: YegP family protein [Clostridia bacterium]|nr:YegP family protein [Clostridia bacterium]
MGKYVIRETKTGFTFRLKAGNGEIIGTSEVYKALDSCRNGIASVAKNAPVAEIEDQTKEGFEKVKNPKFEIYTDKAGETRFRLKAANGEPILASEGYSSMSGCKNGIESVRKNADSEAVMEEE